METFEVITANPRGGSQNRLTYVGASFVNAKPVRFNPLNQPGPKRGVVVFGNTQDGSTSNGGPEG